ncbi:MAG: hypothetical protein FJ318_07150 [SAR202 cluster bacterium]|nr:hypothetical protein [SAR202 cluster bacterium]
MTRIIALGFVAVAVVAALLSSAPAMAQQVATVHGTLRNGTAGAAFDPTKTPVTLSVVQGVSVVSQRSVLPDPDGSFTFEGVSVQQGQTYFFSADHAGAGYSARRAAADLADDVELTVYEATTSTDVLRFESYTIIVTGADRADRVMEVMERAVVLNTSDRTLVPDLNAPPVADPAGGPPMLSFLRFAVPAGATNLDVQSTLVGGDIIQVDRGFAVTTPIPPTVATGGADAHQFQFVYRVRYGGDGAFDLSRNMPFGADAVRVVVPADTANAISVDLRDLGVAHIGNGRIVRLLEGGPVQRQGAIGVRVTALPQPRPWDAVARHGPRWTALVVLPTALAAGLAALLAWTARRRGAFAAVSANAPSPVARDRLLARLAALDAEHAAGRLSDDVYRGEREAVKRGLLDIALRERLGRDDATA